MKSSRYTAEQVAFALRQAEEGTPVGEICRKMGIAEQTFYRWKKRLEGMGVAGGETAEGAGGGEPEAEAAGGGSQPGQADAAGCVGEKP